MTKNIPTALAHAVERRFYARNISTDDTAKSPAPRPVIAISGPHGARREEVARRVAAALGFEYFDRTIASRIGAHAHASSARLEALDEHAIDPYSEALAGFALQPSMHAAEYRSELYHVVRGISDAGNAVVVGHGARYVLGSHVCLRVYVTAPRSERVDHIASRGIDQREAEREVEKVDSDRAGFVRDYFGADPERPDDRADLVVNVSVLGVEGAVRTILAAYAARFPDAAS